MNCLVVLMLFMSDRAGMPRYDSGWAINSDSKHHPVFFWYHNKHDHTVEYIDIVDRSEKSESIRQEYLVIDKQLPYFCFMNGNKYYVLRHDMPESKLEQR